MTIGKKMQDALNKQINAEIYSGYLYLSMASYFESLNWRGMAGWMEAQAGEEQAHAMRIYKFVNGRAGRVTLEAIEKPKTEWSSPQEAFEDAYVHEQKVSKMIHDLVDLANQENDHASFTMLQWFVQEQVEEEDSTGTIADQIKKIKDSPNGLFMLDHALGQRKSD